MSFWGLVLKENKRYSQIVKKAFHISHAALDLETANLKENDIVQVWVNSEGGNHLLCNLSLKHPNVPLDIPFGEGEQIALFGKGSGTAHLTGYLAEEEPNFDDLGSDEEEEEEIANPLVAKKNKKVAATNGEAEDDDDDEDDSDFDAAALDAELESDEEVEDEEEDDDDEDDADSDEEEEIAEPPKKLAKKDVKSPKANQNGLANGKAPKEKPQQQKEQKAEGKNQKAKTLAHGVSIEELRVGKGPEAKSGRRVTVYYEGRLKNNNKVFDSTKSGEGFTFHLGKGEVIRGWDLGVAGMKVGSKRRITCPPNAAYGSRGSPPVIPPNSTLVFDVELRGVK